MTMTVGANETEYDLHYGALKCRARRVLPSPAPTSIQRLSTGSDLERGARPGYMPISYSDLSGGLRTSAGVLDWNRDITQIFSNDGNQCRFPGAMILPDVVTVQESITSEEDISGIVALAKLAHSIVFTGDDTQQRYHIGVGHKIYGNNTTTGALVLRNTMTDYLTSTGILRTGAGDWMAFGHLGSTDGVKGTQGITGTGALSMTALIASTGATDGWFLMQYVPEYRVNILAGSYGGVVGWWWFADTETAPVTPKPLTDAAFSGIGGTIATQDTGYLSPSRFEPEGTTDDVEDDATNVLVSDNVYSAHSWAANEPTWVVEFVLGQSYSRDAKVVGIIAEVEAKESNADDDAGDITFKFYVGPGSGGLPSQAGVSRNYALEITTSDAYYQVGGATDTWITGLTMGDLMDGPVLLSVTIDATGASITVSVDHIRIKVFYQETGLQMPTTTGGNAGAVASFNPSTIAYREPVSNNPSAITKPYRLAVNNIVWDISNNRPQGHITYANPGQSMSVHSFTPFQQGYAVIVGPTTGPGLMVKLIGSDGIPRNLNVPAFHGTDTIRFNSLFAWGDWLIIDVCKSNYTDRQWWFWNAGKTHADTLKQSLSGSSIALPPVPFAESYLNVEQSYLYSIFPRTTHTAASRVKVQPDLGADPRLNNTDWIKTKATTSIAEDTLVYTIGVEVNFGPEEGNKAVLQARYTGRSISSTNTVTWGFNVIGSGSVGSPAGSNAFTTAYATYSPVGGVGFRTLQPWWGLSHTTGTANTPNGLNIVVYSTQQWPEYETLVFQVDVASLEPDMWAWITALKAQRNADNSGLPVWKLTYSNAGDTAGGVLAVVMDWGFKSPLMMSGQNVPTSRDQARDVKGGEILMEITFREVMGAAA